MVLLWIEKLNHRRKIYRSIWSNITIGFIWPDLFPKIIWRHILTGCTSSKSQPGGNRRMVKKVNLPISVIPNPPSLHFSPSVSPRLHLVLVWSQLYDSCDCQGEVVNEEQNIKRDQTRRRNDSVVKKLTSYNNILMIFDKCCPSLVFVSFWCRRDTTLRFNTSKQCHILVEEAV